MYVTLGPHLKLNRRLYRITRYYVRWYLRNWGKLIRWRSNRNPWHIVAGMKVELWVTVDVWTSVWGWCRRFRISELVRVLLHGLGRFQYSRILLGSHDLLLQR
uniref:(northern house mosquito) hypothetical protein n=1 Tax=Culex pipiens TaxID=7175 RepID=A0A8D8C9S9_CULPI